MIAKNEEKVIARCIESYRMAVDEIIVVDTGSTDQTVAIAKRLGAKVFHFTWINDFSAAKNFAISKAKGDWIVFLDADEYFANDTGRNIRPILQNLDKEYIGIVCRMRNIDEVTGIISSEIIHTRIFKNHKLIRYINPIHEQLHYHSPSTKKMKTHLVERHELMLHHTGYSDNINKQKAERNLAMLLKELDGDTAVKPTTYYYIADTYFALGEWEQAIRYMRLFMDTGVTISNLNARIHGLLITAMLNLNYPVGEIVKEVEVAVGKFPQHPFFRFCQAKFIYDDKRYEAAWRMVQNVIQLQKSYADIEVNDMHANFGSMSNMLGGISEFKNDIGAAIGYYLDSLKFNKYEENAFDRLIKLIRMQPAKEIIAFLNTVYDLDQESDLDFLATSLVNQVVPQVLAYYVTLREKKYPKEDYVVLQMLVANGHYDKAFTAILECYAEDQDERLALIAATAAARSGNPAYMREAIERLPSSYGKVLRAYRGDLVLFTDEDGDAFVSLVRTFILWADVVELHKLLTLVRQFPGNMDAVIAQVFLKNGHYQEAYTHFQAAIDYATNNVTLINPLLHYNQGYCLHRLAQPVAAVESFLIAYETGYRVNDIYEYLRWNVDKLDEGSLKVRVEEILQSQNKKDELVH